MAAADERVEINLGDSILVLEGNVIELFHKPSMINRRWHVCHISVDAKPSRRDDVLKYTSAPAERRDDGALAVRRPAVGPAAGSRLLRRGDAPTGRLDRVGVRLLTNGHHSARA
jgi:hypothetical protein